MHQLSRKARICRSTRVFFSRHFHHPSTRKNHHGDYDWNGQHFVTSKEVLPFSSRIRSSTSAHREQQQQRAMSSTWQRTFSSDATTRTTSESDPTTRRSVSSQSASVSLQLYDSLSRQIRDLPTTVTAPTAASHTNQPPSSYPRKGLAVYACGPTTYAPAHLGHARTYVWLDILRRTLEHVHQQSVLEYLLHKQEHSSELLSPPPPPPLFVMNITDVDDKILAAAQTQGDENDSCDPIAWARRFEAEFWRDWDALQCLRPHVVTRVTEHVDSDIVPYIARLVAQGMAYEGDDGVYFDVRAFEDHSQTRNTKYGKLAPPAQSTDLFSNHPSAVQAASPMEVDNSDGTNLPTTAAATMNADPSFKRDPRDFVLWKLRKPGEQVYWDSPWGEGRPGWHIECSAMIESVQQLFQDTHVFGLHAGGVDLKFPHHTNEIAQAEAYHLPRGLHQQQEWISHWAHTGHLHIDGLKMSKSLKNFITIEELLAPPSLSGGDNNNVSSSAAAAAASAETALTSPADDFRLWCLGLSGSYRGPATYSKDRIREAAQMRQKIVQFLIQAERYLVDAPPHSNTTKRWDSKDVLLFRLAHESYTKSMKALCSDLDGSTFVKELVHLVDRGSAYLNEALSSSHIGHSPEALQATVRVVRDMLQLVGFSKKTYEAGIVVKEEEGRHENSSSHVVGGEEGLLEELVRFRELVRSAALADVRTGQDTKHAAATIIVQLCDELRNDRLPARGVELKDATSVSSQDNDDDSSAAASSFWTYCLPRNDNTNHPGDDYYSTKDESNLLLEKQTATKKLRLEELQTVPMNEYFRVGVNEGLFAAFDDSGFPTHHTDGSPISNNQRKKLVKKWNQHAQRLAAKEGS